MLILLMLALAASEGGTNAAPPALQLRAMALTAPRIGWFQPRLKPFGSPVRVTQEAPSDGPAATAPEGGDPAEMTCTMRIIKVDPEFDAGIVKQAPPGLDPKIVRPSPCRK